MLLLFGCCSVACLDFFGIIKECCPNHLTIFRIFFPVFRLEKDLFCHKFCWIILHLASDTVEVQLDPVMEMRGITNHEGSFKGLVLDGSWGCPENWCFNKWVVVNSFSSYLLSLQQCATFLISLYLCVLLPVVFGCLGKMLGP